MAVWLQLLARTLALENILRWILAGRKWKWLWWELIFWCSRKIWLLLLISDHLSCCRRGAHVLLLCQSLERGEEAAQEIREATKGEVAVFRSSLAIILSGSPTASGLGNLTSNNQNLELEIWAGWTWAAWGVWRSAARRSQGLSPRF